MARLVSSSSTEPVTLAEAKAYAKVEHDVDDSIITALITSCRKEIEQRAGLAMLTQVWEERFDSWPKKNGRAIGVYSPRVPLSGASVEVYDSTGTYVAVDAADVDVDAASGRVAPLATLPAPYRDFGGIKVTYTSTITTVDQSLKTALLELVTYRYDNRSSGGDAAVAGWPHAVSAIVDPLRVFRV